MPVVVPQTAHGTTVTLETSGNFIAKLTNIEWADVNGEPIEAYHFDLTTWDAYLPPDVYDPGQFNCEMQFDSGKEPPVGNGEEDVTVTLPDGSTWMAKGFLSAYSFVGASKTSIKSNATWKFTGPITVTPAV